MDSKELLQRLDEYGNGHVLQHKGAERIRQLERTLAEIKSFNGLRNDRDAYLHCLIEWAQGIEDEKPIAAEFGQDEWDGTE